MRKITATLAIGTAFVLSACGSSSLSSAEAVDYVRNNASYSPEAVAASDEEIQTGIGMVCEELERFNGNPDAVLTQAREDGARATDLRAVIAFMVAATESECTDYRSDRLEEMRENAGME